MEMEDQRDREKKREDEREIIKKKKSTLCNSN